MRGSCPLVPGSLIRFDPLIQTMSHSNSKEGGGEEKSEYRMGKRGDTTCGGDDGVSEKRKHIRRTRTT